jgi:hypothetical protein
MKKKPVKKTEKKPAKPMPAEGKLVGKDKKSLTHGQIGSIGLPSAGY